MDEAIEMIYREFQVVDLRLELKMSTMMLSKKQIRYIYQNSKDYSKSIVFYFPIIFHFFSIVENTLIDREYEDDDKVIDANQVKENVV